MSTAAFNAEPTAVKPEWHYQNEYRTCILDFTLKLATKTTTQRQSFSPVHSQEIRPTTKIRERQSIPTPTECHRSGPKVICSDDTRAPVINSIRRAITIHSKPSFQSSPCPWRETSTVGGSCTITKGGFSYISLYRSLILSFSRPSTLICESSTG